MMKMFSMVCMLSLALFVKGCPSVERDLYNVEIGSKAFLNKTQVQHPECGTSDKPSNDTSTICVNLNKAVNAQHTFVDVVEALCAGPNFNAGGACDFPKKGTPAYQQAYDKATAALNDYRRTETDLKGVL